MRRFILMDCLLGRIKMASIMKVQNVCFSEQIKPALITELGDKNWKVRGEALQKVIISCIYMKNFGIFHEQTIPNVVIFCTRL